MNPDKSPAAAGGTGAMRGFKRDLGMRADGSHDVPATVPRGRVSDRMAAVEHPFGSYAGFAKTHRGPTGYGAAPPPRALSDMREALRDG